MVQSRNGRGPRTITLDRLFTVLSAAPRRRIVTALLDDRSRDVDGLVVAVDPEERSRTMVSLHHVHLPRLDDAGVVEWDPDAGTVSRGPAFETILSVVELLDDHREELPGEWPAPDPR